MLKRKIPWLVLLLTLAGILLRLVHLLVIPFAAPFHLGGLFYEFSRQILLNHFSLPQTIPYYSLGGIPFAYPPLAFYIQAILIKLFSPAQFVTVNLLPPFISACTVPAFYWMIKGLTGDDRLRTAALFAFAFMPAAFVNQIEGAGLPEACGTLFLLFFLCWLFRHEKSPSLLSSLCAGIFLGLCVLSSPGSAYAGTILSILFFIKFLLQDIAKHSFRRSAWLILAGFTGLLVSAPYWLTIVHHNGSAGLASAFLAQQDALAFLNQIRYMITFKPADLITFISDEGIYGFLFDWLVFAGLVWALLNKKVFQGILLFVVWLIPREGSWMVAIPAAWLAADGMINVAWPLFSRAFSNRGRNNAIPLAPGLLAMVLLLMMVSGSTFALHALVNQPEMQISPSQVEAFQDKKSRIPTGSHVLIAGNAALREWAPALMEREVLNCEFGLEWQPDELKQVYRINSALLAGDLDSALMEVKTYSGDASVWLVGDPQMVAGLLESAGSSLESSVEYQTPELVFVLIRSD
jgi:hypothetical protein